jgi:hypothetical protein
MSMGDGHSVDVMLSDSIRNRLRETRDWHFAMRKGGQRAAPPLSGKLRPLDSADHCVKELGTESRPSAFVPANGGTQFVGSRGAELKRLHRPSTSRSMRQAINRVCSAFVMALYSRPLGREKRAGTVTPVLRFHTAAG